MQINQVGNVVRILLAAMLLISAGGCGGGGGCAPFVGCVDIPVKTIRTLNYRVKVVSAETQTGSLTVGVTDAPPMFAGQEVDVIIEFTGVEIKRDGDEAKQIDFSEPTAIIIFWTGVFESGAPHAHLIYSEELLFT